MISFFSTKRPETSKGKHLPSYLRPIDCDTFLQEQNTLIKRLKVAYSDTSSWESHILPCLKALALMCGRLPYTSNTIFSDENGLFRASVSAATYAIEIMESTVQLEKNIMAQHILQGRLKAAAALAGLCAFLDVFDKKLTIAEKDISQQSSFFQISEVNHVSHLSYEPLAMPFVTWVKKKLKENPQVELQLNWNTQAPAINEKRQYSRLFYARHILKEETLSWLSNAGRLPLFELMKCLTVDTDVEHFPSSVVKARNLGVYRACLLERERIGAKLGEILEPDGWQETLIRILRARIFNDWEINAKDSPLRKGTDGLFLFWPDVCPILVEDMKTFGLTDLPTDPDIWAGCLLKSGLTLPSKKGNSTCWIAVTPNAKPRAAVKLSDAYFFSSGLVLQAKTIKRDFETDLNSDQSMALSKLTREILEASDMSFTQKLPSEKSKGIELFWHFHFKNKETAIDPTIESVAETLTQNPSIITEVLIDEGIFIGENFPLSDGISFERLVITLLAANVIYQTEKNEPLWVTHSGNTGSAQRGVILKPENIQATYNGQILSFKDVFELIYHQSPSPNFKCFQSDNKESDQLSLNFDEEAGYE